MEALGGAASVIAVVQIAGKVYSLCSKYYSDAKKTKSDIERLMGTIQTIQAILQQVEGWAKGPGAIKLHLSNPSIEKLKQEFEKLEKLLEPSKLTGSKMGAIGNRLKWPLKKGEVEKTLHLVERHKTTLLLALNCDQI